MFLLRALHRPIRLFSYFFPRTLSRPPLLLFAFAGMSNRSLCVSYPTIFLLLPTRHCSSTRSKHERLPGLPEGSVESRDGNQRNKKKLPPIFSNSLPSWVIIIMTADEKQANGLWAGAVVGSPLQEDSRRWLHVLIDFSVGENEAASVGESHYSLGNRDEWRVKCSCCCYTERSSFAYKRCRRTLRRVGGLM